VPQDKRRPSPGTLTLLASGAVEIQGRMPWSSNGTYLVSVGSGTPGAAGSGTPGAAGSGTRGVVAIYKPGRAERPLWDFPDGLYHREIAAYELSEALGWGIVPLTIAREDAPLGPGSLQLFVDADFEEHYFTLLEHERHRPALKRMAVFDLLANNADRKGGHCLLDADGWIWGIDHGLCFHSQPKLRTVIWDFAGEQIASEDLQDIQRLCESGLPESLVATLREDEQRALVRRIERLLHDRRLPEPRTDYPYPWPLV
jgi:uncharacterized repeat protein (TIGR03843 family)